MSWYSYQEEKDFNRAKFYLNFYSTNNIDSDIYPHKFEEPENWIEFLNAYIHIEKLLIHIEKSDFNEKNIHLYDDFKEISVKLKTSDYHIISDDIKQIGSVFLRLFDTLPIYNYIADNDKESWVTLFHAKYLASMFVRQDGLNFIRTQDEIQRWRWRYKMKTDFPTEFQKLLCK